MCSLQVPVMIGRKLTTPVFLVLFSLCCCNSQKFNVCQQSLEQFLLSFKADEICTTDGKVVTNSSAKVAITTKKRETVLSAAVSNELSGTTSLVDTPPNMMILSSYPTVVNGQQRKLNIFKEIGDDGTIFGTIILNDHTGKIVESIKGADIQSMNRGIVLEWLNGRGQPVTWSTFIWALREAKLNTLAQDIKESINPNVMSTQFKGPVYDETLRFAKKLSTKYRHTNIIDKYQKLLSSVKDIGDVIPFVLPAMNNSVHFDQIICDLQPESRTLFTGRPGVGKSTLTRYMAHKWAQGELLTHCVLAVRVPLLATLTSLREVFGKALPDSRNTHVLQAQEEIMDNNGQGVCFILDALDEYVPAERSEFDWVYDLLRGDILVQSTVIVTSRINERVQEMVNAKVFSKLEVMGFSTASLDLYLNQLPWSLKSTVLSVFSVNINVKLMCYLPLHMTMVVYLVSVDVNKISTVDKETVLYTRFLALTIEQYKDRHGWTAKMTEDCLKRYTDTEFCILIHQVCALAYNSLAHDKQSFYSNELESTEIDTLQNLSLFGMEIERDVYDNLYHFTFVHRTFQEYLAAFHMCRSDSAFKEMILLRKETSPVWKFYFGALDNYVLANKPREVYKIFTSFALMSNRSKCNTLTSKYFLNIAYEAGLQSHMLDICRETSLITGPECDNYTFEYDFSTVSDCLHFAYVLNWIPVRSLDLNDVYSKGFDEQTCILAFEQQLKLHKMSSIQEFAVPGMYRYINSPFWVQLLSKLHMPNLTTVTFHSPGYPFDSLIPCLASENLEISREVWGWIANQAQIKSLVIQSKIGESDLISLRETVTRLKSLRKLEVYICPVMISDSFVSAFAKCMKDLKNLIELSMTLDIEPKQESRKQAIYMYKYDQPLEEIVSLQAIPKLSKSMSYLKHLKKFNFWGTDRMFILNADWISLRIIASVMKHSPNLKHLIISEQKFDHTIDFSTAKEVVKLEFESCNFRPHNIIQDILKQTRQLKSLTFTWKLHFDVLSVKSIMESIGWLSQLEHLELTFPDTQQYAEVLSGCFSKLPNIVSVQIEHIEKTDLLDDLGQHKRWQYYQNMCKLSARFSSARKIPLPCRNSRFID